jgi:hypothetical protein
VAALEQAVQIFMLASRGGKGMTMIEGALMLSATLLSYDSVFYFRIEQFLLTVAGTHLRSSSLKYVLPIR